MKELIDSELAKHKDIINSYDGIDDNEFSRLEKMIFDEIEREDFSTVMHHFLELNKKRLSSTKRLKMASLAASGRSGAAPFSSLS